MSTHDTKPLKREIKSIVPDATALKALAHPERLRMLGLLRLEGPATATSLAQKLNLNTGSTSYHLRQLQRHGFIEPAEDLGNKRDRWWRAAHESTTYDLAEQSGENLDNGLAMGQSIVSLHSAWMQQALDNYRDQPTAWKKASTANDYTLSLTAKEAETLLKKLENLLWEAKEQAPVHNPGDEERRQFSVLLHTFPFPGIPAPSAKGKQ